MCPDLEKAVVQQLKAAFEDHAEELIGAILAGAGNQKYKGMVLITAPQDRHYDTVRAIYQAAGHQDFSHFLEN